MTAGEFYVLGLGLIGFFRWFAVAWKYKLGATEKTHQMVRTTDPLDGYRGNAPAESEVDMRTILVDDDATFLEALAQQLKLVPAVQIVARACSGVEALQLARELQPDMVIADQAMPGMNGLELTHELKQLIPTPRVVVLALYDEPEYREGALLVGADAYIAKPKVYSELLPLLRQMHRDALPQNTRGAGLHRAHAFGYRT